MSTTAALDERARTWRLGAPRRDYVIGNVRAVTATAVLDDAAVVVREGRIADVRSGSFRDPHTVDGNGLLLLPGIVDVHSDALENEMLPRPNAPVPGEFALTSMEGRLVGAGVTTVFHGVRFGHQTFRGLPRDVDVSAVMCDLIDRAPSYRVDHRILHRLDIMSAPGAESLARRLESIPSGGAIPMVSHEDHTPGQGQYADPQYFIDYSISKDGMDPDQARENVERLIREGVEKEGLRRETLAWLGQLSGAGKIRLAGHDPDTPEVVDGLVARHCSEAEFPTTLEAARAAHGHGLAVIAGAPNLLRGSSHAGNVTAGELLAAGLLNGLASDYLPAAMLGSVWRAIRDGLVDLPRGISLITQGPARAAGLDDRGVLAEGYRADLALVDDRLPTWPRTITTILSAVRT